MKFWEMKKLYKLKSKDTVNHATKIKKGRKNKKI